MSIIMSVRCISLVVNQQHEFSNNIDDRMPATKILPAVLHTFMLRTYPALLRCSNTTYFGSLPPFVGPLVTIR